MPVSSPVLGEPPVEVFVTRTDKEIDNFNEAVIKFVKSAKGGLVGIALYPALLDIRDFNCFPYPPRARQPALILESFVIQLILAILMMLPLTPGKLCIAEVGATSLYALFIPASIVGIFVVIWRTVLFYFNIALGILSSILIVRREAKSKE